jgi:nicotinate-nucleotide pyrophosphorylase (carboxylating)
MRALEKEAFRAGGGTNHRFNLSDMIMLKENHLEVLGLDLLASINEIRRRLNDQGLVDIKIEVEINKDNLDKLPQILQSPIDVIMLDNFKPEKLTELVKKIRSESAIKIEASGGIKEDNILSYAATGVDYISTGSVFTETPSLDLSMVIKLKKSPKSFSKQ